MLICQVLGAQAGYGDYQTFGQGPTAQLCPPYGAQMMGAPMGYQQQTHSGYPMGGMQNARLYPPGQQPWDQSGYAQNMNFRLPGSTWVPGDEWNASTHDGRSGTPPPSCPAVLVSETAHRPRPEQPRQARQDSQTPATVQPTSVQPASTATPPGGEVEVPKAMTLVKLSCQGNKVEFTEAVVTACILLAKVR